MMLQETFVGTTPIIFNPSLFLEPPIEKIFQSDSSKTADSEREHLSHVFSPANGLSDRFFIDIASNGMGFIFSALLLTQFLSHHQLMSASGLLKTHHK